MASPAPISFARGAPSLDIMPADDVLAAAERALKQDPAGAQNWAPVPPPPNERPIRTPPVSMSRVHRTRLRSKTPRWPPLFMNAP